MATSTELRQQRARVVEAMRAITDTAESENRDLTAEERQSYDRGETEFSELSERIGRQEQLEERERLNAEPINRGRDAGGADDGTGGEAQARRAAFCQYLRVGRAELTPEQRTLVQNEAGEILVPEDLEAELIRRLPNLTVIRSIAGGRNVSTNRIRRRSLDEVSVGWGKLETGQQQLTDSMPDTPTEEYTYIEDLYGLARIGEDELDDSDVNLEAFVADSFSNAIAETEDTAFTVGAGHGVFQPVGIFSAAGGIPTIEGTDEAYVGDDGVKLIDDMRRLIYATPAQARRNGSFLLASATELLVATTKDGDGQYYWQPSVQAGRPNTFLGYAMYNQEDIDPVGTDARIAAFGDWNAAYRVYTRMGMALQRLNELYAEEGLVGWKARFRVGGDVVRPDRARILRTPGGNGSS